MSAKEKARPAGSTAERAAGKETGQASNPAFDYSMVKKHEQGQIEATLTAAGAFGEKNALPAKQLYRRTGLPNSRSIRLVVNAERRRGAVILSGDYGYCLPSPGEAGKAEIRAFVARMESQAWNTHLAVKSAQIALDGLDGQLTMDGGERTWTSI